MDGPGTNALNLLEPYWGPVPREPLDLTVRRYPFGGEGGPAARP